MRMTGILLAVLGLPALMGGCSHESALEVAYDACIDDFTGQVSEVNAGEDFGDPGDYMAVTDGVLTVKVPSGRQPGVGEVGANAAALCVLSELGAPRDVRRSAGIVVTAGSREPGRLEWPGYSAAYNAGGTQLVIAKA